MWGFFVLLVQSINTMGAWPWLQLPDIPVLLARLDTEAAESFQSTISCREALITWSRAVTALGAQENGDAAQVPQVLLDFEEGTTAPIM